MIVDLASAVAFRFSVFKIAGDSASAHHIHIDSSHAKHPEWLVSGENTKNGEERWSAPSVIVLLASAVDPGFSDFQKWNFRCFKVFFDGQN